MRICRVLLMLPVVAAGLLSGCAGINSSVRTGASRAEALSGSVHGGQQPVVGATIQLYGVGMTGDGSAATPLLTVPVLTGVGGNFSITGDYNCTGVTQVYLVATGGNPGLGTINPNLAEMTALGACSSLSSATFVSVNELTTVAATSALAPYMNGYAAVGSGTSDAAALVTAFALAGEYVDTTAGTSPGLGVPSGQGVPISLLNSLADVLASCVNSSGGTAGDGTPCGTLFQLTTVSGSAAPTNGIGAMLNVAKNPTLNAAAIFALATPTSPFQPVLASAPTNLGVALSMASLQFGGTSVSFGQVAMGVPTTLTVNVANSTAAAVAAGQYSLAGANAGDFSQTNTCATSLNSGAACTLTFTFTPSAAGARTATLVVRTGNMATEIALSGTGVAVGSGPVTLTMPTQIYAYGQAAPVTVTNSGSAPVAITSVSVASPLTARSTCGSLLLAQSVCYIYIFSPSQQTTTVGNPTLNVVLNGTTTQTLQVAAVGLAYLAYGQTFYPTMVGTTSSQMLNRYDFTSGTDTVTITGRNASDFTGTACNNPTPGQFCYHYFGFTPSASGLRLSNYNLSSGEQGALMGFGIGTTKNFEFVPDGYDVGTVPLGNGGAIPLPVSSSTTQALTFMTPTVSLATGASGSMTPQSGCTSLAGYVSPATSVPTCNVTVYVSSLTPGQASGIVSLSDTSGVTRTMGLFFTGVYNTPSLSATSLSFGTVAVGTTSTAQTVQSTVQAPLTDPETAQITAGSPFTVANPYCAHGPQCTFSVTYAPTASGASSATLTITDLTSGLTATAALSGTGQTPSTISVSPTSVTFSSRPVGSTSLAQTVTVMNTGGAAVVINNAVVGGANVADFSQTNNCTGSLAVGASCTLSVSFTPQATGSRAATITLTSTAASSPNVITLSGTGS